MSSSLSLEIIKIIATVFVAVIVSLFAFNKELKKIKQELERDYSKNLFEKRMECYSELHFLISSFLKRLRYSEVSFGDIEQFVKEFDKQDSKCSFLFVESTSHYAWYVQRYMHLLINNSKSNSIDEYRLDLANFIAYFEYILRAELGTFDKEVAGRYPDITGKLDMLKKLVEGNDDL